MSRRFFVWAAVLGLFADQLTKLMVYGMIEPGDSVRVIGNVLRFIHTDNPQGVFGLNYGPRFVYYILPAIGAALVIWFGLRERARWSATAYGLILAGALGNLADRVRFGGRVIDFIDFSVRGWHWYTFNVADTLVFVGIVMLLGREFLVKPKPEPATGPAADAQSLPRQ
jgi:signal peptidase II